MSYRTATLLHMTDSNPRPPVVVEYSISWSGVGASEIGTFEIDRDEWDAMSPAERLEEARIGAQGIVENTVTWGWHIEDPDDYASTEEPE